MKRRVIHHLIHILPGILIYYLLPMAFVRGKEMLEVLTKVCAVYIIVGGAAYYQWLVAGDARCL